MNDKQVQRETDTYLAIQHRSHFGYESWWTYETNTRPEAELVEMTKELNRLKRNKPDWEFRLVRVIVEVIMHATVQGEPPEGLFEAASMQ